MLYGNGYIGSKYLNELNKECYCVIKKHKREFLSTFGKISYYRAYYNNVSDGHSYGLTDFHLGLQDKAKISPALRYFAGLLSINLPYTESSKLLSNLINVNLSSTKIDDLLQEKGKRKNLVYLNKIQDIEHDSDGRISSANLNYETQNPKRIIYLETDGCHIRTLEGWNECKTFVLFETKKVYNSKTNEEENIIFNKKYYSTMNSVIALKKQLKVAIEEYCGKDSVQVVCIGDGAAWIWKMCRELFSNNAIEVLDWYHIDEKVCELSNKLFEDDETLKEEFQLDIKGFLYRGRIDDALEYLHSHYDKIPRSLVSDLMCVIGYIENNKFRMNYFEYKENRGLIIGYGTIESANKYVLQRRMKQSGMRWDKSHANNIAQLISDYINGDFDNLYGVGDDFRFAKNIENDIKMVN